MKNANHSSARTSSATASADDDVDVGTVIPNTSSGSDSSVGKTTSNSLPGSLRALNRASYKISKPLLRNSNPNPNKVADKLVAAPEVAMSASGSACAGGPPYQPQPPVYNIDKNDFRDVVQKLTGSPAHSQIRRPPADLPPLHPPRPCSSASLVPLPAAPTSRLHRIRPPPLVDLTPRPPPSFVPVLPLPAVDPWMPPPLSPLPPLPTVSAAAESPISAYMRHLRSGSAGLPVYVPPSTAAPMLQPPSSPLGLGCLLSPQTAYQMMMAAPGLQLPTSPGVQVPSPRLGDP